MVWEPTLRELVVSVAIPETNGRLPSSVGPSKKLTVPVGVPNIDVTFTIQVTGWPKTEGFGTHASVVDVGFLSTV